MKAQARTIPDVVAGRFRVRRRIGEGQFGVVYEALDLRTGEAVALKQLREPEAATLFRFKLEFRLLADIEHVNLLRLHELFEADGLWFILMELVVGRDFLSHVRPGCSRADLITLELNATEGSGGFPPPDERRVRDALGQLAAGVHALHEAGRLHRDLKPSNVLVGADDVVRILDFGLVAELSGSDVEEGREWSVRGTPVVGHQNPTKSDSKRANWG